MKKIVLTFIAFFGVFGLSSEKLFSQVSNKSFWYGIQLRGAAATGDRLPFWLYANRHATVDPYSPGGSLILDFHKRANEDSGFHYGFGATVLGRASKSDVLTVNQLYGVIAYGAFQIKGGRFYDQIGDVFTPLSMGSLALSANAVPVPKIKMGFLNYTPVPFTGGFVEFKGAITHGWLGGNRRVKNAWLHQKYLYLRFGGDFAFRPYIGLVHQAQWAGTLDSGFDIPDSFTDFGRVFFALGGDEKSLPNGQVYVLGNHLGIWDLGFNLTLSNIKFKVYRQFIYDDKEGLYFKRLRDGLLGISAELPGKNQKFVTAFLWEYLNTKWQGGPACPGIGRGGPGGCENYYNNVVYQTGWSYLGNTLGNALFLPVDGAGVTQPARRRGITNNRIIAQHFGLMGELSQSVTYKLLATWSRNYAIYKRFDSLHLSPNQFESVPEQWSFLLNFNYRPQGYQVVQFNLSLAADTGDLYKNSFGILFGIKLLGTSSF